MAFLRLIDHYRGVLVSPPLVFSIVYFGHEYENDAVVLSVAIPVFLVGLIIRVWAQQHLHYRFRGIKMKLTTTGPYSLVRNPLYIANTIMFSGLIIASELLWLVPVQILWCTLVYSLVARYEEPCLIEKYGQKYKDYMTRVPRWLPRLQRWHRVKCTREYLTESVLTEIPSAFLIIPWVAKEAVFPYFAQYF